MTIFGWTFLLLLGLKLTGLAAISWWWVWTPVFIGVPLLTIVKAAEAAGEVSK